MITVAIQTMLIMNKQRKFVLREISKTEGAYVNNLKTLIDKFIGPMTDLLSKEQMKSVFSNVADIFSVHREFLQKLNKLERRFDDCLKHKEQNEWKKIPEMRVRIARHFVKLAKKVESLYTPFICNLEDSQAKLKCFMEHHVELQELMKSVDTEKMKDADAYLQSLLVQPFQRLGRYPLLFKELLKSTNEVHPDYPYIKEALSVFEKAAQAINSNKAVMDSKKRKAYLQNHGVVVNHEHHAFNVKPTISLKVSCRFAGSFCLIFP